MPTKKEAMQRPANLGEVITPATPFSQNVPPIIPREQPGLSPTSLGPAPAVWTSEYDKIRQWVRPGTSQGRFPALPTKINPQINASASSVSERKLAPVRSQVNQNTIGVGTALQSTFLGAWNASTMYFRGNTVVYSPVAGLGSFYWVCTANTSRNNTPNQASAFWQLVGTSAAVLSGLDGVLPSQTGQNLVFNGDFSIVSAPTGIQSATASAIRTQDGVGTLSCNGWTRNFESSGNGEGICYQLITPSGQGLVGPFTYILQGNQAGTGVNTMFAIVCDAFSIRPTTLYSVLANVNMGYGSTPDAHARWFHRILFYRNGAVDFSRNSADLISYTDITSNSALTGPSVSVGTVLSPANSAFARVAFYKWSDSSPATHDFNLAVSNCRVTNTLDDITDGSTFGKVLQTGLTANSIDPSKAGVLAKGSTPTSLTNGFSYTSAPTLVTISWTGMTIFRADGSTTAVANGSQLITGLTASTSYRVYPYYDESTATLSFVSGGAGVGSPAICYAAGSNVISQAQNLQSRVPLSISSGFIVTTPSSGSGGGTGGGSGGCLRADMLTWTENGICKVGDVQIGDRLLGERGWQTVTRKNIIPCQIWIHIQLTDGSEIITTTSHPFTMPEGSDVPMKRASDLSLNDFLITTTGGAGNNSGLAVGIGAIKSIEVVETKAYKVSLTVEPDHSFFAGKESPTILAHNYSPT